MPFFYFLMFTFNITFVVASEAQNDLIAFIRNDVWDSVFCQGSLAFNPELKKLIRVNGELPDKEHGCSVALSAHFNSIEEANDWDNKFLRKALNDFNNKFGNEALYFTTLLEELTL